MTAAFDKIRETQSVRMNDNDDTRRTLALIILGHVDRGERDPVQLFNDALRYLADADRTANG